MNLDIAILKSLLEKDQNAVEFTVNEDVKYFDLKYFQFATFVINYVKVYKTAPTKKIILDKWKNNAKLTELAKSIFIEIEQEEFDIKEYPYYLTQLKRRYQEKLIKDFKKDIENIDLENLQLDKVLQNVNTTIHSIKEVNNKKSYQAVTLKDLMPTFKEEYKAKQKDKTFDSGIKTGYKFLDEATLGLRPAELLLIGAESGGGKSMMLMNMAIQMWLQENKVDADATSFKPGNDVLYFSLEMPIKPCSFRMLGRLSQLNAKKIRSATLDFDEMQSLKNTIKFIEKYPNQFQIVDSPRGTSIEFVEKILEEAKQKFNPKIIVLDYLSLMELEGGESMDDWLKLGKIAEKVHEFARVHNVIVLSAVQLNRSKPSKDIEEKVGLHRVGRSALILQNANIALQILKRENEGTYNDLEVYIIKNRDGELTKGNLIKDFSTGSILDNPDDSTDYFTTLSSDDIANQYAAIDDDDKGK